MSYEDLENLHDDSPQEDGFEEKPRKKIKILTKDSKEFKYLINTVDLNVLKISSYDVEQLTPEYLSNIIRNNNIKIPDGVSIYILPVNMKDCFGFILPNEPDIVYLVSTPDEEIYEWIYDVQIDLKNDGYDDNEIKDITIDNKRASTIIHEIGHCKVDKFIGNDKISDKFKPYIIYLHQYYVSDYGILLKELEEILAEDYRQIAGGPQSSIPNRYLYPFDTIHSQMYKHKEERLNILRKLGVF